MITRENILKGRDKDFPLSAEMEGNLLSLIAALKIMEAESNKEFVVTSGYRPPVINQRVGGARKSRHQTCQAADIADPDGSLADFVFKNLAALERANLWIEAPSATPGWVHFQTVPPKSGKRIFTP